MLNLPYVWLYKVRAKPATENYATKEGTTITRQTGEVEWTAIKRTHDGRYQAVADEGQNGFTADKGKTFLSTVYEPTFTVIPSICWSDHDSFEWCFDGEPVGGCVAVSSVGAQKSPAARALFMDGYNEMLRRLKPEKIIFFGDVPSACEGNIKRHDPFYKAVHARRRC